MSSKNPRKPPKEEKPYHHGDLRQELVRSALELLEEVGPHGLSLREVARKAGVSHAAPYRHFQEKEALLASVAEAGYAELARSMDHAIQQHPDPLVAFQATGRAYVSLATRHPQLFRLMFSGLIGPFEKYPTLAVTAEGTFAVLRGSIEACQRAGVMRAADPDALALAAWALAHGLSMLLVEKQFAFPDAAAEASLCGVFENLVQGLRKDGRPRR